MKKNRTSCLLSVAAALLLVTIGISSCHEKSEVEPDPEPVTPTPTDSTNTTDPNGENEGPLLFIPPITEWGCSEEYVKAHQQQGKLTGVSETTNRFGEKTRTLAYDRAGFFYWLRYTFTRDKLNYISIMMKSEYKDEKQITWYLENNYTPINDANMQNAFFIGRNHPTDGSQATVVGFGSTASTNMFVLMVFMPWIAYESSQPLFE